MAEAHVASPRQPFGRVAVEPYVSHAGADAFPQSVSERGDADGLALHVARADLHRLAEPDDSGHVLGARAPPPLVLPSVLYRDHLRSLADVERRHAFGAVDLVTRERQQVDSRGL